MIFFFFSPRILNVTDIIKKGIYKEYGRRKKKEEKEWERLCMCKRKHVWEKEDNKRKTRPYGWQRKPVNAFYKVLLFDPLEFIYTTVYLVWMLPSPPSSLHSFQIFLSACQKCHPSLQVGILSFSTTPKDTTMNSTLVFVKSSLKLCNSPTLLLILLYAY